MNQVCISFFLLTIQHLWSHPVRVPHDSVPLLSVDTSERPLLVGGFFRWRLDFVLYDESGQSKVGHDHSVVLLRDK